MFVKKINNIQINDYTGDVTDRGYDFSLLNAVSTCPFYGILRHIHSKVFTNVNRNMALECGDLCHKCYAAYRAFSVYQRGMKEDKDTLKLIGLNYLKTLINPNDIQKVLDDAYSNYTKVAQYTVLSNYIIDHSEYYDDPEDKKRTIANIKDSLLNYLSNFLDIIQTEPVWVEDENNINSKIGIEIPYNLYVDITYELVTQETTSNQTKRIHFIGKLDGIHIRQDGTLIVHENKTASRLDDSWSEQWFKSHQITGYCLAASYFTNSNCLQARVLGMQIPLPKYSGIGFRTERVDRNIDYFEDWGRWVLHTTQVIDDYKNNPELSPMNTHACCKYYKACSFMPLCCENKDRRKEIIDNEMVEDKWSPLDE